MWHTPLGTRRLLGAERYLYKLGYRRLLLDAADEPLAIRTGSVVFDGAPDELRLVGVVFAAKRLLDPRLKPPHLTEFLDAAAAVPLFALYLAVLGEIKTGRTELREPLVDAARVLKVPGLVLPNEFDEPVPWRGLVDRIAEHVAWRRQPTADPALRKIASAAFDALPAFTPRDRRAAPRALARATRWRIRW